MGRSLKEYIVIGLKGMAMGAADVVPGVSGGTIAFISGIYEELLASISNVNFELLKTLKSDGIKAAWKQVNGSFLLALFIGIFISIISLAKTIKWLLENEPILLWSFFFGLVLASIIYIGKQISKWNTKAIIILIIGAFVAYYITTLNPLVTENSSESFISVSCRPYPKSTDLDMQPVLHVVVELVVFLVFLFVGQSCQQGLHSSNVMLSGGLFSAGSPADSPGR
ncbi:DUF368 domain-containing protein, partial [uncultured Polaribacter sp.]|uniref:DUF368 domain-containing protein n=1 Tax=uncultured Polaribacter sp. TaxID=174711 RepID=UPI0030DA5E14